jgi:hypothetical protein
MMKNRRRWVLRAAKLAAVASLTSMSLSFLSPRANAEELLLSHFQFVPCLGDVIAA